MTKPGHIRIIGGKWRSRQLMVAESEGLRPTADRVRETVFNWLAPKIQGARCCDLFAGTGALGFEALSRGAQFVHMVEKNVKVVDSLKDSAARLKVDANDFQIEQADAIKALKIPPKTPFDIIFLDPPFRQGLSTPCLEAIVKNHWLSEAGWVYLEIEQQETVPLNDTWVVHRSKQAGQLRYHILERVVI